MEMKKEATRLYFLYKFKFGHYFIKTLSNNQYEMKSMITTVFTN